MRTLAITVLLAACGGGSKPVETAPLPPDQPENAPTPDESEQRAPLAFEATGAAACDALVVRTICTFDKAGDAMPDESRKAFADGVNMWRENLTNEATRQATIDACEMSLEAGRSGYEALACWTQGDAYDDRYAVHAYEDRSVYYQWEPTGAAECDELIKKTLCTYQKAGEAVPIEALKAFHDATGYWKEAIDDKSTRAATIDACKMSLDAGKDGFAAQGC